MNEDLEWAGINIQTSKDNKYSDYQNPSLGDTKRTLEYHDSEYILEENKDNYTPEILEISKQYSEKTPEQIENKNRPQNNYINITHHLNQSHERARNLRNATPINESKSPSSNRQVDSESHSQNSDCENTVENK